MPIKLLSRNITPESIDTALNMAAMIVPENTDIHVTMAVTAVIKENRKASSIAKLVSSFRRLELTVFACSIACA
ncbi:hypothetical protein D3C86_1785360 [compost metagenome]